MAEISDYSIKKNIINLARNKPVALVVAAGSFLGSFLVDKLIDKGIQVIGVDDLEEGEKKNLIPASSNTDFHLLIESPDKIDLELPRLDYVFIVSVRKWNLDNVLQIFKKYNSRCLLVSSIELYEKENNSEELKRLKNSESKIAKFASEYNLNARVLRLGPVFGPRMDFKTKSSGSKDPAIKLIQQALTGDLQKDITLEFSSRALYFTDAVDLMIRTIFAGSTSQKIFDGVNTKPIKVAEIKQVLMDPVWYENKEFTTTELPPWPTPNLEKTVKFLNWHPQQKLVSNLKETLSFFKDNEIDVPKYQEQEEKQQVEEKLENLSEEKKEQLEAFKEQEGKYKKSTEKGREQHKKIFPYWSKVYLVGVLLLIGYALIWPIISLGWGIVNYRYQLDTGLKSLKAGELDQSMASINSAYQSAVAVKATMAALEPVYQTGIFTKELQVGQGLTNMALLSASSAKSTISGIEALLHSIKAITGEKTESPAAYLKTAKLELDSANESLAKAQVVLNQEGLSTKAFTWFIPSLKSLSAKLNSFNSLISNAQATTVLLPQLVAVEGSKSYLVLLQNNMELRPGGGFIGSFAKVTFTNGKLQKIEVNDIYNIDGNLNLHVEPPAEIKNDLGQKDWFLRDSNWEQDFPTSARQAQWFYSKETGDKVDGVIALDVSAVEELLRVIGPIDLPDYNEKITADNLFAKAVTHAEMSFFPGSQAKKSFLTALTDGVFSKMFFLPQSNWPKIISSLSKSLQEKHISIYLNDAKLFAYIISHNLAHTMPRPKSDSSNQDFLSVVEANLGANKVNYYLDRSYNLQTEIGKDGEVRHKLKINYTNRSPSEAFPGGKYKNRMRFYLPFGAKLEKALWGESDITKDVTGFVDYGRSGFSMLLELMPKEQKNLILSYSVPIKLEFAEGKTEYRLDVIKQSGTLKDPFTWTMTYPIGFKIDSSTTKMLGPQEHTITTDLSTDRSFEVKFSK